TDIDSQKRNAALLEQRIAERTAKLQQTVQELEGFSYSLSHDMRAPLRAMRSYAEIAQRECSHNQDALACDYLGRIIESAQRLDHLILDSLNYSQILRDELPVRTVELAGLLRGIIDSNPNLEPPAAEIRVAFKQLLVRGNEAALTQCFSNLLDNAAKFTAPNTKPRVNIRAQELTAQALLAEKQGPPKTVRVWVEDNGIGIPKDSQEMIFGMFQRMHPEQAYPGTGIGLAIVKKAVERMGGKVGVESEVNRGSRFWVELPAG
ncbi:MAG TPA: HAMP domain-containing sensor histidine kinase, partial [Candidatus Sulfotelmatobacter sp.]|nr:HAMP domain-containing sensor histidine kinase [Candidatus Sulfotelmatobacter sp.]